MHDTQMTVAGPAGVALRDPDSALKVCGLLLRSGMLPADIKSDAAAFAILQTGAEMGLAPMQALRSIHVVKGRPILSADLMVAMCLRSGQCRYFRCVESTDKVATYETLREGMPEPVRMSYSMDEANAAGLTKNPTWRAHARAMLRARAKSALARDAYPDLVAGLYSDDEGREIAGEYRRTVSHPVDEQVIEGEVVEAPAVHADLLAALKRAGLAVEQWDRWAEAHGRTKAAAMVNGQVKSAVGFLDGEGSAVVSGWIQQQQGEVPRG